jgi:hypothetical protein
VDKQKLTKSGCNHGAGVLRKMMKKLKIKKLAPAFCLQLHQPTVLVMGLSMVLSKNVYSLACFEGRGTET